jgi:serine/threonine protein kinase/tetratricopeptide (TPR) repeat protein
MTATEEHARSIFLAALDRAPDQWSAYLNEVCGDAAVQARVEQLLQAHRAMGSIHGGAAPADSGGGRAGQGPGTVIGPYKLLEQIGEGGFGVVYMAEQSQPIRRKVALKVLKPGMDTRQVVARFEAERQALALMDHPNIAKVFDGGATPSGRPYFVMELVRGVPVTEFCDQHHLTPRQRLELFVPVCRAVQHAHQKGIIHRDLKPSNILVTVHDTTPVPKVIDFGIAKALGQELTDKTLFTGFVQMLGTPLYMSPEQAGQTGLDADTRSDVYSLGVLLYELLTGTTPITRERFRQATYDEVRRIIREEESPKPSTRLSGSKDSLAEISAQRQTEPAALAKLVRGELDWIVMKALEKDRSRRYETANGLAQDIERHLRDEPVLACPPTLGYRLRKFVRRNRTAVAMVVVGLVLLVLFAGASGWMASEREHRRAQLAAQLELILDEVRQHEADQNWHAALATARRAESLVIGAGGDAALEGRVRQVLDDLKLVERLEAIRLERDRPEGGEPHSRWADRAYAAAFRDAEADVDQMPPDVAAERLHGRAVAVALATALDDWTSCRSKERNAAGAQTVRVLAQRLDPDPWRGQLREATARKDAKELEQLAAASDLARQPPATLLLLSGSLAQLGRPEHGVAVLRKAHWRYPNDFWLVYMLGSRLRAMGPKFRDEATAFCRTAVALRPRSAWAWHSLGNSLARQEKCEEALAAFRQARALEPTSTSAQLEIGHMLGLLGRFEETAAINRQVLAREPNHPVALSSLGWSLIGLGKPDEAAPVLRRAVDASPKFANAHANLGRALAQQGHWEEAVGCYWTALECDPTHVPARRFLFDAVRHQEDREPTIAFLTGVIEADPRKALAHWYVGNARWWQGKPEETLAPFRKAVALAPHDAEFHHSLANTLRRLNKLDEALATYARALELGLRDDWLHFEYGAALSRKGRLWEAVRSWKISVEINPDRIESHLSLSWHLATAADPALRDPKAAVAHAQKVVDSDPKPANNWGNLGVARWRAGELKGAVEALEKADGLSPDGDMAHRFFLAMAYWQIGEKGKARTAYEQGERWMEEKGPASEELRRFRAEAETVLTVGKK